MSVRFTVNGRKVSANGEARQSLADFLRETMNLTGTHLGCEHGVCGACTINVDGQPTRSCLTLAVACEGSEVHTIEGLQNDRVMIALMDSFHTHHGLQCGYCTPGMLVSARDLILRGKAGNDADIRRGLAGNLCRCTGYTNIVTSIAAAAAALAAQEAA